MVGVAPSVIGNLPQFDDLTSQLISDSGIAVGDVGDVKSSSIPSVDSRIALFDGITGKLIKEASMGIDETDVQNIRWVNSSGSLMAPGVGAAALSNCFFGRLAGENTSVGGANFQNTSVGTGSFTAPSGAWGTTNNTAIGRSSLAACNGRSNTAVGSLSLYSLDSTSNFNGNGNCAFGHQALYNLGTDANLNIAIGQQVGSNYTAAESNNLLIGSNLAGVTAESNTTRIGQGQTRCFVEGISGVQAGATYENVRINPVDGQLATDTYAYSEQYIQGNTFNDTSITVGTWADLNGAGRVNGPANDFLQNVGYSSTYTGTPDIRVQVNVCVSWENDSSSNIKVQLGVFKNANALPEPNLRLRTHLDDGSDYPRSSSLCGFVNLSNGDTLSVQVLNETDSDDIIFWSTNFNIHKIGLA